MVKIDFVLPWVDGSDKEWLALKRKYEGAPSSGDAMANADIHYRDYGLLRYWFRAVERFAPWVNRVFFVTCGQRPEWLNPECPRLRLVDHKEYIPAEYLPTFHSNTIELNLHRLPDLSEHFVLFNDDIFLLREVEPDFFFKGGKPVLDCNLGIPDWLGCSNTSHMVLNNCGILKRSLDVEALIWKNIFKFMDVRSLGFARAAKNLASIAVNRTYIPGTFGHLACSHLKSTFEEIWQVQPRIMEKTSQSRFRTDCCVNHWLALAWNMVSGRFAPANNRRLGKFISLGEDTLDCACATIKNQSAPVICINDKASDSDLNLCFSRLSAAFEKILPEKCSFEK